MTAGPTFEHEFKNSSWSGSVKMQTGLFIGGEFVASKSGKTLDTLNPVTGKIITSVAEGDVADVDLAVEAAQKAYDTVWGDNVPPAERGKILMKLADLLEQNIDELAALESLDNGKAFSIAKGFDVAAAADCLRYYGGWADKDGGKVINVDPSKMVYTRHEPIGVVGQIIPWNFPILMLAWKLGPALATGNTIVLKPSEMTPLTALRVAALSLEAGVPKGVLNIVNGYGLTVGNAIASHMKILKVAFTGSTLVGRQVMKSAAASNLKNVTLELGGKSPNIILDDANIDEAVSWACFGIFLNHGQACCAGSRVFVHESIYDTFMEKYLAKVDSIKLGDPYEVDTFQGPQISQTQYDRIMNHIDSGKKEGATLLRGGDKHGDEGFFIQPTVFSDVNEDHTIFKEEIFGPVVAITKFSSDEEVIRLANQTEYGLASAVFSRDISRAIGVANKIHAGTVWVNCYNQLHTAIPFGGFKSSGIGRELGEYALHNYTSVKAVHINLSAPAPM